MRNYTLSDEDLKAIEKGISCVWDPKLDFIFQDKEKLKNIIIISFDTKELFVWKHKESKVALLNQKRVDSSLVDYELFTIQHNIAIEEKYQLGWGAGFLLQEKISQEKILNFPKENIVNFQIISGAFLTQFINSQKAKLKTRPLNPYTTYESYLATIVHEFGHAYYNNFHTWWYSNKTENLDYLYQALDLYQDKKIKDATKINFPSYDQRLTLSSELFAFCTDYTAASIFWESHKKDIDKENINEIKSLIKTETAKDLFQENSVLDPDPTAHRAAQTIGKILLTKFPKTWPEKILNLNYLLL